MSIPVYADKKKIAAIAGITSPILAFCCIFVAVWSYPVFSWTNNALSDLGIVSGITGPIFNFGLSVSGLLAFIFAVFGLFKNFNCNKIGRIGSLGFAAVAVSLFLIGVFNENFRPIHYFVSVAFFAIAPLTLLILTFAFYLDKDRKNMIFTLLIAFIAAATWILQLAIHYVPNVAIPEFISGLAISIWVIVLCKKIYPF